MGKGKLHPYSPSLMQLLRQFQYVPSQPCPVSGCCGYTWELLRNGWLCGAYSQSYGGVLLVLYKGIPLGEMAQSGLFLGLLSFIK